MLTDRLRHGGHSARRRNAANACITQDPAGSHKIDKARSTGRTDGLVALAMAIGLADRTAGPVRSPYQDREGGFLFL